MNVVLILYPTEFKCLSKFKRKIARLTSNLADFRIVSTADPNALIETLCKEQRVGFKIISDWKSAAITHAIIFDDGEVFPQESEWFRHQQIGLRIIKIKITRVINVHRQKEFAGLKSTSAYEYIGRGSYWGNPYSMHAENENREEVIRLFKYDFDNDKFPRKRKSEVYKLAGKRLGCFCKPEACHGDVIADFLNSWDDGN